jgi:hypothetical protein
MVVDSIGGRGCMVLLGRCWLRLTSAWLGRMSSISSWCVWSWWWSCQSAGGRGGLLELAGDGMMGWLGGDGVVLFVLSNVRPVVSWVVSFLVSLLCQWMIYQSALMPNCTVLFIMRLVSTLLFLNRNVLSTILKKTIQSMKTIFGSYGVIRVLLYSL